MLLAFRAANHRSLRTEQQLTLTPVYDADRPAGTRWEAVPVVGLFGANASGKSNLVDALAFLRRMVLQSDRLAEPYLGVDRHPFALDPQAADKPSWYVVDCSIGGVRHTFGVALDSEKIVEEWLYSYPRRKKQKVFHRVGQSYTYGVKSSSGDLPAIERLVPGNALFISTAARSGMVEVQGIHRWFKELSTPAVYREAEDLFRLLHEDPLVRLLESEPSRRRILELLKVADFGIEDIDVEPARDEEFSSLDRARGHTGDPTRRQRVWLTMRGPRSSARLGLEDQSAGTRTFLSHLPDVLKALTLGSVLVLDELESNLHPLLAEQVIKLFQNPQVNRRRAQLVFTTHNTSALASNGQVLKRDQVWFVEKSPADGSSSLYPLSAFKPRVEENTERRYLHGAYGAIPFIDEQLATEVLSELIPAEEDESAGE